MPLTLDQYYQLQDQYERTPHPSECSVSGEHYQLAAVLSKLGYYVTDRNQVYSLAEEVLLNEYPS